MPNISEQTKTPVSVSFQGLYSIVYPYPDLGLVFAPSSQWLTAFGPMDQKVLQDLFGWLSDPVRDFKVSTILSSKMR